MIVSVFVIGFFVGMAFHYVMSPPPENKSELEKMIDSW